MWQIYQQSGTGMHLDLTRHQDIGVAVCKPQQCLFHQTTTGNTPISRIIRILEVKDTPVVDIYLRTNLMYIPTKTILLPVEC